MTGRVAQVNPVGVLALLSVLAAVTSWTAIMLIFLHAIWAPLGIATGALVLVAIYRFATQSRHRWAAVDMAHALVTAPWSWVR